MSILASISGTHILLIVLVIVLLFGASSIPKLARSIGRAKSEFEKGVKEGQQEHEQDAKKAEAAKSEAAKGEPAKPDPAAAKPEAKP